MQLQASEIRDILLELEEKQGLNDLIKGTRWNDFDVYNRIPEDRFNYTLAKMLEAGLINGKEIKVLGGVSTVMVSSISFDGHQFLDTVRDPKIWDKTLEMLKPLASTPITAIASVATKAMEDGISNLLHF